MPRQVCHEHCPGGGGGLGAALVVLVVIVGAAIARPAIHALSVALEVVFITAASLAVLAAAGLVVLVALRVRRGQARTRQALPRYAPRALDASQGRTGPRAIEAPKASLADLKAAAAEHGYDVVIRQAPED